MLKNLKKSKKNINYILKKIQNCSSMLKFLYNFFNKISINVQFNIKELLKKIENIIIHIKSIKNRLGYIEKLFYDEKNKVKIPDLIFSQLNNLLHETNNNIKDLKNFINDIYESLINLIEMSYSFYEMIPKLM